MERRKQSGELAGRLSAVPAGILSYHLGAAAAGTGGIVAFASDLNREPLQRTDMAARAYWSGQLKLALVSIPVQIFSATKSGGRISFHQVHEPSRKRVRYEKVVPGIGSVDTGEIVKGYAVDKDQYVLLSEDELNEVKVEAKRTVELVQFVEQSEIDPIYFDRPFFVAPDDEESASEAYVVLRAALRRTGKIGLGQLAVRGRSHIVALKPCREGLLMETLRYADELRKADSFFAEVPEIDPDEELVSLAEELIGRRTKKFDPKAFKDSYEEAVRELIEAKIEKRQPERIDAPERGGRVVDLMEALKRSVGEKDKAKGRQAKGAKGGKRAATGAKSTAKGKSARRKRAA
jgi:DNA end-binding protein Ku